jgi:hypothetical protein
VDEHLGHSGGLYVRPLEALVSRPHL